MTAPTYAVATDAALSRWGLAPRRSVVAIECHTEAELAHALRMLRGRVEMRRVRTADGLPRQRDGQHIAVFRRATHPNWFPKVAP